MTSQAGHHGGGSQLYPNQCFVNFQAAGKNVLSHLRTSFQVLSSICFRWQLLFLCTLAFILTYAHGEMQTGVCELCPSSSTKWMNICMIPYGHLNMQNLSPVLWRPPSPSRTNVKVVVVTVLASSGGIGLAGLAGLAGWLLYKRWRRVFTEADIIRGLLRGPAVARRTDPTFEIPRGIGRIAN